MTQSQKNTVQAATAALECLALFAEGRNPYPERADAVFDAKHQAERLRVVFPEAFAK